MKIGLLEDNPELNELMRTILEMTGYSVCSHRWGKSLLEALFVGYDEQERNLPYDLLIVDLNLPGELSGQEVITAIRHTVAPEVLPIVVVSAGGLQELDQLHKHFPTLPIVRKPFSIQTLLHTISQVDAKGKEQLL